MQDNDKKSPIRDRMPLRQAGQSVQEELDELIDGELKPPALTAFTMLVAAICCWWTYLSPSPIVPTVTTIYFLGFSILTWKQYKKSKQKIRNLKLARDGERAVGEMLHGLREHGYHVFHDIQGIDFNIDHLLIGPAGVFTIETKTWSKGKSDEVQYDGNEITVNGFTKDRDPVVQGLAQGRYMSDLLNDLLGAPVPVQPVVIIPGWFVRLTGQTSACKVWVFNDKGFSSYIARFQPKLNQQQINQLTGTLQRWLRQTDR